MLDMKNVNWLANRYELSYAIGNGSLGTVYRAFDHLKQAVVALKLVDVAGSVATGSSIGDNRATTLANEFQVLATIRHPHIISVLDYGFDSSGQPFYTMEFIRGGSNIISYCKRKTISERIELLLQMLQALTYLHQRGIIHRDIKPANIMVDKQGQVKLLDFGLATLYERDPATGMVGTLKYMSPEVIHGGIASKASDLWSVGMVAYELLTGKYPFDSQSPNRLIDAILTESLDFDHIQSLASEEVPTQHTSYHSSNEVVDSTIHLTEVEDKRPPSPYYRPPMSPSEVVQQSHDKQTLAHVVAKLLERNPAHRYQDAVGVIADLSQALEREVPPESLAIRESVLQNAPFTGRKPELEQLTLALDQALDGFGSSWLLLGESGIGKSRLLNEIRIQALVKGALVLDGQQPSVSMSSYDLWQTPLCQLILSTPLQDSEVSILSAIIPDIARLAGKKLTSAPSNDNRRKRLIRTIVKLFKRQVQPMVLLLEDVHWSDESLEPLIMLTQMIDDLPLLIVATYTYDNGETLPSAITNMNTLQLERLNNHEIAQLSRAMLGDVGEQPDIVSFLQRETQGNVSYIIEVLRAFAERQGRLSDIGQAFASEYVLTQNVEDIIQHRFDQLAEWQLSLLQVAAVMGRRLDIPTLESFLTDHTIDDWLMACSNVAIIDIHDGQWQFAQKNLRVALLAQLDETQKQSIHHQIALAIEKVYGMNLDRHLAQLVVHWHHAANLHKEWEYAQLASQQAYYEVNFGAARDLYERALHLSKNLADVPDQLELARLYHQLADIYLMTNRQDDQSIQNHYEQAMRLYQTQNHQLGVAEVLRGLGNLAYDRLHNYELALSYFESAVQIYRTLDKHLEIGAVLIQIGNCWRRNGELLTAEDSYLQSLEIAEAFDDIEHIAQGLLQLGIIAQHRGMVIEAKEYLERSLDLHETIDDLLGMVTTLDYLAGTHIVLDNIDTAQHFAYHALRLASENKLRTSGLAALVRFAMLKIVAEQYETALTWLSLILHHECSSLETIQEAQLTCNQIVDVVSEPTYESLWQQGQHLDYDALVQTILLDYSVLLQST